MAEWTDVGSDDVLVAVVCDVHACHRDLRLPEPMPVPEATAHWEARGWDRWHTVHIGSRLPLWPSAASYAYANVCPTHVAELLNKVAASYRNEPTDD